MAELDRYLIGIGVCLIMLIPYACFRMEVYNTFHYHGMRTRHFYKLTRGFFNYFWYRRLDMENGCRFVSVLSIIFTSVFPLVTLFHIALGWWSALPPLVDSISISVLAGVTAFVTGFTVVTRNRRLFESPFVFLAAIRVKNQRGNFLNTAYYSIILDFIYILFPLAVASVMYFL